MLLQVYEMCTTVMVSRITQNIFLPFRDYLFPTILVLAMQFTDTFISFRMLTDQLLEGLLTIANHMERYLMQEACDPSLFLLRMANIKYTHFNRVVHQSLYDILPGHS